MNKCIRCILLPLALLAIYPSVHGQTHTFKPDWKKGDVKTITYETIDKEYLNDSLTTEEVYYNDSRLTVLEVTKTGYVVELLYVNQALRAAQEAYAKFGDELKEHADLRLKFALDRTTMELKLLNWKDSKAFMEKGIEQIRDLIISKDPDLEYAARTITRPMQLLFQSQENVEAYMLGQFSFLLVPFEHPYELNKTISTIDSGENPMNPGQEMSATTMITLRSVDDVTGMCTISHMIDFDMSEYMEMLKAMMQSMSESFGASDSTATAKSDEMDQLEAAMTNEQILTYNSRSTWVEKMVATSSITMSEPSKGVKRKDSVMTVKVE